MASKQNQNLLQCTGCYEDLNLESKTLPCLHSFCNSCLDTHFEGQTNENSHCPECHEHMTLVQLSLSPFLVKSLRRRQLESTDWKCDLCSEDGIESTATNACHDCQKLFCANCSRIHKKLQKEFNRKHNMSDLDGMERGDVIKAMMADMCSLHQKEKDSYCNRCNVCLCDICYQNHSADSPRCSSRPLSVKKEALKQKSQSHTLAKEMDDLEMSLKRLNERTKNYTEELNSDCDSKCQQLWQNVEEMMENAKRKTQELCEEMRQMTTEQVKRWRHSLEENKKILKQLEIWRINLHHLLNESQQDGDVVCNLRSLKSKLSSRLNKSVGPEEICQLGVTFSNWWQQAMEKLKNERIGSVSLAVEELPATQRLVFDQQWNLDRLTGRREHLFSKLFISSIQVSKDDEHVFVCDLTNNLIIEFTESGELVHELYLFDAYGQKFGPWDMCSISTDMFVVACGRENKLILLKRRKIPPFLQIKKIINTENTFYSLCEINESIFVCDNYFQIDSFTKEGEKIKTIKTGGSESRFMTVKHLLWCGTYPRIRADPSTKNFWGTQFSSEIFCFNPNGEILRSVKIGGYMSDFCVNEFGHYYFCNYEGIFSFTSKKTLCSFESESNISPSIFILRNKIFVCLRIKGNNLIKIFKILC